MKRGYASSVIAGSTVADRKRIVEEDFATYVKGIFDKHGELQSALLTVAQYWADEADDAVHATVVFSPRATPLWPHRCSWENEERDEAVRALEPEEQCTSCGDYGWMPFDDNGSAISAFQSCCREDASQESSTAEAYLPYAIARRSGEIEIIGAPVRAWLDVEEPPRAPTKSRNDDAKTKELFDLVYASRDDDGPRQVLADFLVEHDDALGAYITSSLASSRAEKRDELLARTATLEAEHGRSWLGPLADVAPVESVVFDRGFPSALAVHLADDAIASRMSDAREWGTIERLRFLPQSKQVLSKAMRSLRDVGPLHADGFAALVKVGPSLAIERAHVVLGNGLLENRLHALDLPKLRVLTIGTTYGGPGTATRTGRNPFTGETMELHDESLSSANLGPDILGALRLAPSYARLDELVIASTRPDVITAWLALSPTERPRTISFTSVAPSFEPGGFRISVTGDVTTVSVPSLGGEATVELVVTMLDALPPKMTVVLEPTAWWEPGDDDVSFFAEETSRKVGLSRREE